METSMMAAVVTELGAPLEVGPVPVPEPGPGEALVRVRYSGVCHTDLHAAHGDWPVPPETPFIPGHEGAGEVVAVGEGVTRLSVGDLVGNAWLWSACGDCEFCQTGRETLCPAQRNAGYMVDGSFARYMLVDARFAARLPPSTDLAAVAPVLCAGVTVYKGLKTTGVRPGEWCLVSGVGGLGHLAVQYAAAMGMRVVAVDVSPEKTELALDHGAEAAFDASAEPDVPGRIRELTGGGAHGGLVTAVNGAAFPEAVAGLRRGGTVSLVGLPPERFGLDIVSTVLGGLTVRGSIVGTRRDLDEAIDFFARGLVRPTYQVRPLTDVNAILADLAAGRVEGRVVMDMRS
jgi:propanol-preferring alcohol dehydrogenase